MLFKDLNQRDIMGGKSPQFLMWMLVRKVQELERRLEKLEPKGTQECRNCNGVGHIPVNTSPHALLLCPVCKGTGKVSV